jgi:RNA polymerase sigma-70 factor (ECF subfamily)
MMDWKSTLLRYSMRIAGNRWDAEDLAQDAALKVMKAVQENPARPVTNAYLYRIALNVWKDKQRKRRVQADPLDPDTEQGPMTLC